MPERRRLENESSLLAVDQQPMAQFPPISYLLKTEMQGFYLRLPFQRATPAGFLATHIPKGNHVHCYQMAVFSGIVYFSRSAAGLFS